MMNFNFPFHLVSISPWPLLSSFSGFYFLISILFYFYNKSSLMLILSIMYLLLVLFQWWRDVIRESGYQGFHTSKVFSGIKLGMLLFILSEMMLFVSFFWTYFHLYLSPSIEVGGVFPSEGVHGFDPLSIPLLNTVILLSSGISITWAHHSIMVNNVMSAVISCGLTLILGGVFSFFQYMEYCESFFTISDSSYGSIFFLATGFHGMHVMVGSVFIFVSFLMMIKGYYSYCYYGSFEFSSWYWHFVDVVWLFLYIFMYWLV